MRGRLPVDTVHLTIVDSRPESVEILVSLVALDHQHLEQRHLVADAFIQVLHVLSDCTISAEAFVIAFSSHGPTASVPLEADFRRTDIVLVSTTSGAFSRWGSATCELVFPQVGLNVSGDHLVQHGVRDVLQWCTKGYTHLVFDLAFQEVVETLTLHIG